MIKAFDKNPEYLVSDSGKVYRVIELKPQKKENGYVRVQIYSKEKKRSIRKNYLIHRLVMQVFKGEIPRSLQVNHLDKNKLNNNLSNLEIVTHLENMEHRDKFKIEDPF